MSNVLSTNPSERQLNINTSVECCLFLSSFASGFEVSNRFGQPATEEMAFNEFEFDVFPKMWGLGDLISRFFFYCVMN